MDKNRLSVKPITVEGVTFHCYRTGILRSEWRSEDGVLTANRNTNRSTYHAGVNGDSVGRLFRSLKAAMGAAVKASKAKEG